MDKGNQAPGPPEGRFTAEGVMLSDPPVLDTPSTKEGKDGVEILGGDLRVSILVRDPYTAELIRLDNVVVKKTPGTIIGGLAEGQRFRIQIPSYEDLRSKRIDDMEAEAVGDSPVLQNKALPTPIKYKNSFDAIAAKPSMVCKAFKDAEEKAKAAMGLVVDRTDLSILQGPANGRSPGIAVHQQDGKVYMFDNTGKQYASMDGQAFKINAVEVDMGQAKRGVKAAGFPIDMEENPMKNYMPQGPIVSPHPNIVPAITKMMNTINYVMDIVDFVQTCGQAVQQIQQDPPAKVKADAAAKANESSFSKAIYGETVETADPTKNANTFDPYVRNKK